MSRKPSLKDLCFRENSGDFSGAGTFQGGPFGFGNDISLPIQKVWPGLIDPEEDLLPICLPCGLLLMLRKIQIKPNLTL